MGRHPGLGYCSNCFEKLTRTTTGNTTFKLHSFKRSNISQALDLSIGNALNYVFKVKGDQAQEVENLTFCTKCHALFASIFRSYCDFAAASHPESVVLDVLEGIEGSGSDTWPGPTEDDEEPPCVPVIVKLESLLSEAEESADDELNHVEELGKGATKRIRKGNMCTSRIPRKRKSAIAAKRFFKSISSDEDDEDVEANTGRGYHCQERGSSDEVDVQENEDESLQEGSSGQVASDERWKSKRKKPSQLPTRPDWILEETYSSAAEALAQIELEGTWSLMHSKNDGPDKQLRIRYYRCNQVPKRRMAKDRCAKRLKLQYSKDSSEVLLYRCGEAHTNHSGDIVRKIKPKPTIPMCATEAEQEFYADEHGVVLLRCFECSETFSGIMDWANHQRSAHNRNRGWGPPRSNAAEDGPSQKVPPENGRYLPCPAPNCFKLVASWRLRGHIQNVHKKNPSIKCSECGKGFSCIYGLRLHVKGQHPADPGSKESHLCRHCGNTFGSLGSLERHEKVHLGELERPHLCNQCGIAFETKQILERHLGTHLPPDQQSKPFSCAICSAAFRLKTRLDRHQLVHSEKRDLFKCTYCDRAYPRKPSLLAHYLSVHKVSESVARAFLSMKSKILVLKEGTSLSAAQIRRKPGLTCEICSKKYTRREYLTTHLMGAHGKTEEEAKGMTGLETKRNLSVFQNVEESRLISGTAPGSSSTAGSGYIPREEDLQFSITWEGAPYSGTM